MKECCKKWKESLWVEVAYAKGKHNIFREDIKFCPECGLKLKKDLEESDLRSPRQVYCALNYKDAKYYGFIGKNNTCTQCHLPFRFNKSSKSELPKEINLVEDGYIANADTVIQLQDKVNKIIKYLRDKK